MPAVVQWWWSASGDAGGWDGGGIADDCGWNAKEEEVEEVDGGRGGALEFLLTGEAGGRRERGPAVRGRDDSRGASERPVCAHEPTNYMSQPHGCFTRDFVPRESSA